jgi:ATP-dependent exoDNAse (exonuclease V) beta subunit
MNVHQSKGLGFDMVIVSGLDKRGGGNGGAKIGLGPSADEVKWGVLMPANDIAVHDTVLDAQLKIEEADEKFGEICTAYVALTRAKKALYVVTNELGETTKAKNFARHLLLQFGATSTSIGNANWYRDHAIGDAATDPVAAAPNPFCSQVQGTPKPASPSSFKAQPGEGMGFVSLSREASELGTEVHEALAGIGWLESSPRLSQNISQQAANLLRGFLEKPIAKDVFTKPDQPHNLWRERAFDVTLDGQWVSGVFDRVLVYLSEVGKPTSAIIYDFKTDHGSSAEIEERYAGQMENYRQAVCKLLAIPSESVSTKIVRIRG